MWFPKALPCAAIVGALLLPRVVRAEQFVLFDTTYTHTNANDSHHTMSGAALKQPSNWTSPINYSLGTIHFYQEVMTKPSNKPTIIDFCLISTNDYGCIETFVYTTVGLNETVRSMAGKDVDKRSVIDFTKPMKSIQMVLKTPAPTYINGGSPQSDFLPSKMRFVATLVSPGGTYVPPAPTPGFNPGDGGVVVAADAARSSSDASDVPAAADAAAVGPDAAVAPPVSVDAAIVDPKPPTKADAAIKPPAEPDPDPEPEPTRPRPSSSSRKSGGCAIAGAEAGGAGWMALALALLLHAYRRRSAR